jgi:hypothetical protein
MAKPEDIARQQIDADLKHRQYLAERMLCAQAIERSNWSFLGSDGGGRTAAVC